MTLPRRVHLHRDTCNVFLLVTSEESGEAIAIDFGSGSVLDSLAGYGITRLTDVLMTHHHRDQGQGLHRAAEAGARIWVPSTERDLFAGVGEHWQARQISNSDNLRQDRFSVLDDVPVAGVMPDYRAREFGGLTVRTLPTPGHTPGSVTYLAETGGRLCAFTGDLIYAPGKIWSVASTQWTYSATEGIAATMLSLMLLSDEKPDLVLPSHGEPMADVPAAFRRTITHLREFAAFSPKGPWDADPEGWLRHPWEQISPHLLRNRTSVGLSYALLSDAGGALMIDYGYDMATGIAQAADRSARRPWLASLGALQRDYGIDRVEVATPTHYHDDHVAGFSLLTEVHGTEIWSAANIAPVLGSPRRYDLPCLWWDEIAVHRALEPAVPVRWREYEMTTFPLPGHTLYAAAIAFEADGVRVLATGDQQDGGWQEGGGPEGGRAETLNFHYRNRFRIDDFARSAELYQRLRPGLMISGHWAPRRVTGDYLAMLAERGAELARIHRQLLPLDEVDFGAEGFGARIEPYQAVVADGVPAELAVHVMNPFAGDAVALVRLVVPDGWQAEPAAARAALGPHGAASLTFAVRPRGGPVRRARVAASLTVGGRDFGLQAEALITVI